MLQTEPGFYKSFSVFLKADEDTTNNVYITLGLHIPE